MEILNVGICEDDKIEQKVLLKLLEKSDYNIKIELFENGYKAILLLLFNIIKFFVK